MSDYAKLYKEVQEIENILKSIVQNENKENSQIVEIVKVLNIEYELLKEFNFTNYFSEILV